jgi:hypothetical protein
MEAEEAHITTPHDDLMAQIWSDLRGQVSQERIRQVATEAAALFRDATITAYIPLLLRRIVRDRLLQEMRTAGVSA